MEFSEVNVVVGGNFVVEPLSLYFPVLNELVSSDLKFRIFNPEQIFVALSSCEKDLLNSTVVALFLRIDGWFSLESSSKNKQALKNIQRIISNFSKKHSGRLFIFNCPPDKSWGQPSVDYNLFLALLDLEDNIEVISYRKVFDRYPVNDVYDSFASSEANVPYSSSFYKALAIFLFRLIFALDNNHKVIAVDCDNTLWTGFCGDAVGELSASISQYRLQSFIKTKLGEGFLLCLVSKNNFQDVKQAFDMNPDFFIKIEDAVCCKINWEEKADNLIQISQELNLGLDQFIFIDDSNIECDKVSKWLPQVTVFQWQNSEEKNLQLIDHAWAFDKMDVTSSDKKRSVYYKREAERLSYRNKVSQEEYLKSLAVSVAINPAKDFVRLAQLSLRINQFRMRPVRLRVNEIKAYASKGNQQVFQISVTDCFGSYGTVGFIMIKAMRSSLYIKEFCLSCRAFGREVEIKVFSFIEDLARKLKCIDIKINLIKTGRNMPAIIFLKNMSLFDLVEDSNQIKITYKLDSKF